MLTKNQQLLHRWHKLRLLRLVPQLLHEPETTKQAERVYTFANEYDPWGSKELLQWQDLEKLILDAEAKIGPRRECNDYTTTPRSDRKTA